MATAFITGAGGFIGGALLARLRSEGHEVGGVDLSPDPGRGIVSGDVGEPGAWQRAAVGADLVFHTAAAVTNTADYEAGWRINVRGTKNAIDAAVDAGASRFVHFSSVRAFSDRDFPDGVDESHPVRPDGSVYVDTKIASEQVALQAHAEGRIEVSVVRPGDVYGPRSRPWTILIIEAIRANQFVLPAMGRGVFSPVYIDNLVDGAMAAALRAEAAGQIFTISDGVGVSCRRFFRHYFEMLGKRGPYSLPTSLAVAVAAAHSGVAALAGRSTEIRPESVRYLARPGTYSIEKARRLLGYEPRIDLEEGMRRTERWLEAEGMLAG